LEGLKGLEGLRATRISRFRYNGGSDCQVGVWVGLVWGWFKDQSMGCFRFLKMILRSRLRLRRRHMTQTQAKVVQNDQMVQMFRVGTGLSIV